MHLFKWGWTGIFALSIRKVFSIQSVKELYSTTPAAVFSFQVSYIVYGSFSLSEAKSGGKKKTGPKCRIAAMWLEKKMKIPLLERR